MPSKSKGLTFFGKVVTSVLGACALVAFIALGMKYKATRQAEAAQEQAQKEQHPTPAVTPPVKVQEVQKQEAKQLQEPQPKASGSEDPYANLTTKGDKQ
jgi:hypothetical protein